MEVPGLTALDGTRYRLPMPTMTKKEFYRRPAAPDSLRGGETITVTNKGKPQFEVTPVGRKGKSGEEYRSEALALFPGKRRKLIDTLAILRGDER